MTATLTKAQQRVLTALAGHIERVGYPPSVRELMAVTGHTSPSSVTHHLRMLQEKGFIRREPGRARTIVIVSEGAL